MDCYRANLPYVAKVVLYFAQYMTDYLDMYDSGMLYLHSLLLINFSLLVYFFHTSAKAICRFH
jgi:hypothetical protein